MVLRYTYNDPVPKPDYIVESYSDGATATMPEEPFEEREEEASDVRP